MAKLKDNAGNETIAGMKAAVVGGGPSSLAAAYFLEKPVSMTVFEKKDSLRRYCPPCDSSFRISDAAIENDIALVKAMGGQNPAEYGSKVTGCAEGDGLYPCGVGYWCQQARNINP